MASISLRHIYKIYAENVTVVNDFNLEIQDKEFVVLVGPSGCGKSTTLRMIAGLEEVSKGELHIGDRLVNDVSPKDRNIAMVFQNYALYPNMTVFNNIAFGLEMRKMPKPEIDKRVREAAGILAIDHLLDRKPRQLSGGQRQRVALGRAMVRNPAAFLLDEPLSNLDAKLRTAMRAELIKLHQRLGSTFVYVTHDQTEAMTMGDRIVVMKDGIIQQADIPQNLYAAPRNVFVAGFIGSPQMNFLDGLLDKDSRGYFVTLQGDSLRIDPKKVNDEMAAHAGSRVQIGIRPEDIHTDQAFLEANPDSVITAAVEVNEVTGSEAYLHLDYSGARLIARVDPKTRHRVGDAERLGLDPGNLHMFDGKTGEAIMN